MGTLLNLQRGVLPNIYPIKKLIKWFDAVSNQLDASGSIVAAAVIDGGANIQRRMGITTLIAHPSAGNFVMQFDQVRDPNKLYPVANIYSPAGPPGGAINIYPTITDATHVSVAIWQIAVTTAARTQIDEQFCIVVYQMP